MSAHTSSAFAALLGSDHATASRQRMNITRLTVKHKLASRHSSGNPKEFRMRRAIALVTALAFLAPASATADTTAPVLSGLRGVIVKAVRCDLFTVNGDDRKVVGTIRSFRVCPLVGVDGTTGPAVLLSPTKRSVAFRAVRAALAAADGIAKPGQVCAMYADVPRLVFAVTSKGTWQLHIPVDSCNHYGRAVLAALGAAA